MKIKEIMLAAQELNMVDSGEYVFFNIELLNRYVHILFFLFSLNSASLFRTDWMSRKRSDVFVFQDSPFAYFMVAMKPLGSPYKPVTYANLM